MARCMKELLFRTCNNGKLLFQHSCASFVHPRYSSTVPSFKCKDLRITLTDDPKPKPDPDKLVFGKHFSDHMFEVHWSKQEGWGTPQIVPLQTINLHPASKVFHYATELFEGMKAYRGDDDKIRLFRPMENIKRMYRSAGRATLPQFDKEEFLKCLKKLISIEREWVPYSTTSTLYIRPTMIATEPCLGVSSSNDALMYVITGPVGPYYPTGMKPITLYASDKYVRAWPGGSGSFKMGSNYAPTMLAQNEAIKRGCQQVLWLYGEDHQLTEVGAMNLFLFWKNEKGEKELITAPQDGLILPGITRMSILDLARQWDEFKVTERPYTMKEVLKALKEKRVMELFGSGTACVVCPVEAILYNDDKLEIPTMRKGAKLAMRFTKKLADIQYGREPSKWTEIVED